MLLKKTLQKTKKIFSKSIQNLKTFLFCSYESIPRALFLNPLSCICINGKTHHLDHIYPESSSSNQVSPEHDRDNSDSATKHFISIVPDHCIENGVTTSSCEITEEMKHKVEKVLKKFPPSNSSTSSFRRADDGTGTYMLEQKMKELEMMDAGDVDHTLDVEEALHCYSLLTCPEYVHMVNKFFMDMYTDFNVPQPSISKSSSTRRLGPLTPQPSIRISSSSKGIESALSRQSSKRMNSLSRRLDPGTTPQLSTRINSSSRRLGPLTLCFD